MLVSFAELLSDAESQHRAVGAFTAYNLETAVAVCDAASRHHAGVMLLVSAPAFTSPVGPALTRALLTVGAQAPVPCCIQLDHVADLDTMRAALEAGVGAVMADGSKLAYDDNVDLVAAAVRLANGLGGAVEAELGRIEGDEEVAKAAATGRLTDPHEADTFVACTGAACLAVSIGNAHGRYDQPPQLDLVRLERIQAATDSPLSLHGASGLPEAQVTACVRRGIRKVNVNTELRDRYFDLLASRTAHLRDGARLLALQEELIAALSDVVNTKLALFAGKEVAP